MTRRFSYRAALASLAVLVLAGACRDELPTAPSEQLFPRGTRASTFILDIPAAAFLQEVGRFTGYTAPRDVGYLLVANRFGGALEAHSLVRLTEFPTSVTFTAGGTSRTDSAFVYTEGRLMAAIDTAATSATGPVELQLWTLSEAWDRTSVTWETAIDTAGVRQAWSQPGGTRGRLISSFTWTPGDTLTRDSLAFVVDSLAVQEMAAPEFPGLLVTASGTPVRFQLGRMVLRTGVRPASQPDTVLAQNIVEGPQTFIFAPQPPTAPAAWQVGGIEAARVLMRLDLQRRFPCPAVTGSAPCVNAADSLRLRDVALNQVSLLLDPQPTPGGFRPLEPMNLRLRRISEPELGRRAPLGEAISQITLQPELFTERPDTSVALPLIGYLQRLPATDTTAIYAALLAEPEAGTFGLARFGATPRLRVVYTLPLTPVLP